jgi:hypothetical protein
MKYEKPEVKMFKFDVEDVITTSMPTTTTTAPMFTTTTTVAPTLDIEHGEIL